MDNSVNEKIYPFEIHLTIEGYGAPIEWLQNACNQIGNVKLIILDLYTKEGIQGQVTTSSTVYGNILDALNEKDRLYNSFKSHGIGVIREKLETVPWHPMTINHVNHSHNYFESHLTFVVPMEEKERVDHYCHLYDIHLSRNALKHDIEGLTKFMGTIRTKESKSAHETRLNMIINYLKNNHIKPDKIVTEYAFYDNNELIDTSWLGL